MNSLDVLYYSLAIGFLILVIAIAYAFFHLAKVLKAIKVLIESANIGALGKIFQVFFKIINLFFKSGGDKNE